MASITKKNYIRIAREIKNTPQTKEVLGLVSRLTDYFKEDNPNFQADKFFKACGYTQRG